jgi:citrate synthase
MISGLEDVVAAETILSDVDGQAGRLVIRGHSLDDLVNHSTYEDVLALLWEGLFTDAPSATDMVALLGKARKEVFAHLAAADTRLLRQSTLDAVRALVATLPDGEDVDSALQLVAAPAVFTPGILRLQRGLEPIQPSTRLSNAADMLHMLRGELPTPEQSVALDRYLVTASDHGLNASTFAARVVASTRAGLASATLAAMSALKGPLHGGAPGPVLDTLDSIGNAEHAIAWLQGALNRGERLMGFGHRVYRVRDPRADAIKQAIQTLADVGQVDPDRLRLAEAVESAALDLLARKKPDRPLQTNLEFYTALLLEALGFPREAFTCVFAAGRAGGWIAHAREQTLTGRLIRPQSRYIGPKPGRNRHPRIAEAATCPSPQTRPPTDRALQ